MNEEPIVALYCGPPPGHPMAIKSVRGSTGEDIVARLTSDEARRLAVELVECARRVDEEIVIDIVVRTGLGIIEIDGYALKYLSPAQARTFASQLTAAAKKIERPAVAELAQSKRRQKPQRGPFGESR